MTVVPPGFEHDVAERLEEATRPRAHRSVVVFDFDNTCIRGDIGELFSYWLVEQQAYRYDLDAFWALVDDRDGRAEIRELVEDLQRLSASDPARATLFAQYRAEMAAIYPRKLQREGKAAAYEWAVRLHVGLTEPQMHRLSDACVVHEWSRELETDLLETNRGEKIEVERGIRRFAPVRRLMAWLRQRGHEVWIVSATNEWTVRRAATILFGVSPEFVLGNRVKVRDGELTATVVPPALFRQGKVEIIEREIGVRPLVVFGDSETDLDMLSWAEALAVVIDHGEQIVRAQAAEKDWAIQPRDALKMEEAP